MVFYLPLEVRAFRPPISPFTTWASFSVSVPKALDTATIEERDLPDEPKTQCYMFMPSCARPHATGPVNVVDVTILDLAQSLWNSIDANNTRPRATDSSTPLSMMSTTSRYAFQSPSISDEKGAYRMRPPRSSRPGSNLPHFSDPSSRVHLHVPYRRTRRLAMLLALLACGALVCFACAYWLFTTRYGHPSPSVRILWSPDSVLYSQRIPAHQIGRA